MRTRTRSFPWVVLVVVALHAAAGCRTVEPCLETRTPARSPYAALPAGPVRYVADRVDFFQRAITIEACVLRVPRDRLPRPTSLLPLGHRAGYAVIASRHAMAFDIEGMERLLSPRVRVHDGRRAHASAITQLARIAGARRVGDALDPLIATGEEGDRLDVRPALAGDGSLLVLDLRHEHVARAGPDLVVRVHDGPEPAPEGSGVDVTIPELAGVTIDKRFTLRRGEVLVLLQPAPAYPEHALVTLVTWEATP